MIINSKELCEKTGATYRQIDYWCSRGYIEPIERANPGTGSSRQFSEAIVDKVKLLVDVSAAISNKTILAHICTSYEEGHLDLGNGITLSWDIVEIERRGDG